jgi:hypothetical protein
MVIHIVRFRSSLPDERIPELFQMRASEYLAVPGLLQKYYLRFRSGEHGGVYVWDSAASMERFMGSRLARTICDVYRVEESVRDAADVVLALYPQAVPARSSQPAVPPEGLRKG